MSDRLAPERKLPIGHDHAFEWRPTDGYPDAAPSLTVAWPSSMGGSKTYALTPVRAADTVAAGGYDHGNARLSLTVGAAMAGALRGIIAEHGGEAWLDGGPDYQGPVRLLELVSDGPPTAVVQLAEPLPRPVDVDGSWSLRYLTYAGTIPSADLGTARVRNVSWTVPWLRRTGADAPTLRRVSRGFAHVVHVPFDTGLDDAALLALCPPLARTVPDRQSSWAEQRWLAESWLVERIRVKLPAGRFEDDVLAEQFRSAHALMAASIIRGGHAIAGYAGAAEDAERLMRDAEAALGRALARITYLDLNGDAVVDEGETEVKAKGVAPFRRTPVEDDRPEPTRYWDPR